MSARTSHARHGAGRGRATLKRGGTRGNLSNELPLLEDGVRVTGTVQQGSFKYFHYKLDHNADITISVFTVSGDPDLYVASPRLGHLPTLQSYSWNSAYVGGDTITIFSTDPDFVEGTFVIGIYGQSDAAFKVIVSEASAGGTKYLMPLAELCLVQVERSWSAPFIQELLPFVTPVCLQTVFDYFSKRGLLSLPVFERFNECDLQHVYFKDNSEVSVEWIEKMMGNKGLASLRFVNCSSIGDKAISVLKDLKTRKLESIEISGCIRITGKCFNEAILPHKSTLKSITLSEIKSLPEEAVKFVGRCLNLAHINFSGCDLITDSIIPYLKPLSALKTLKLAFSGVSGPGLVDLKTLVGLTELDVSNSIVTRKDKAVEGILPLRYLEKLHLGHNRIGDVQIKAIGKMTWLVEVYVPDTTLSSAGLQGLQPLKNLRILDVSRTRVGSCDELAPIVSLVNLNLSQTQLSDAESVQGLTSLYNLETLNVANTMITDESITCLLDMVHLKHLDVSRIMVTDIGLSNVIRSLKGLESLSILSLNATSASLAFLAGLYNLTKLAMSHSSVADDEPDACVLLLHTVPSIIHLELLDPRVTDLSIEALGEMKQLMSLSLNRTRISDAALSRLKRSNPILTDHLTLVGQWAGQKLPEVEAPVSTSKLKPTPTARAKTKAVNAFQSAADTRDTRRIAAKLPVRRQRITRKPSRDSRGHGLLKDALMTEKIAAEPIGAKPVLVNITNQEMKYYSLDIRTPSDVTVFANVQHGSAELYVKMCSLAYVSDHPEKCLPSRGDYTWFSSGELLNIYHTHAKFVIGRMFLGVGAVAGKQCRCIISVTRRFTEVPRLLDMSSAVVGTAIQKKLDKIDSSHADSKALSKMMTSLWGSFGRVPSVVNVIISSLIKRKSLTPARLAMLVNEGIQMKTFSLAGCEDARDDWLCVLETQEKVTKLDFSECWHLTDNGIASYLDLEWKYLKDIQFKGTMKVGVKTLQSLQSVAGTLTRLNLHRCVWVTDENFTALRSLVNLTSLSVAYCGLMGGFLGELADMTNLEELDLTNCIVTGRARRIKSLAKLKKLRILDLKNNNGVLNESAFCLKSLPAVTSLNMSKTQMGGQGIAYLKSFSLLEHVDLGDCQIADNALSYLVPLPNIKRLILRGTMLTDAGCEYLNQMTNLVELDLQRTKIGDAGVGNLFALSNLAIVGLSMTLVGDACLASLVVSAPKIASLSLLQTTVTETGIQSIFTLQNLSHLAISHISSDPETADRCAVMISNNLHGLTSLELLDSRLTGVGATRVTALPRLSKLSLAQVRVSDAHISKIRRTAPCLRTLDVVGRVGGESRRSYYWTKVAHAVHWIARTSTTVRRLKSKEWGREVGSGSRAGRGRGKPRGGLKPAVPSRMKKSPSKAKKEISPEMQAALDMDAAAVAEFEAAKKATKRALGKSKSRRVEPSRSKEISPEMQAALDMDAAAVAEFEAAKKATKRALGKSRRVDPSRSKSSEKPRPTETPPPEPVVKTPSPPPPAVPERKEESPPHATIGEEIRATSTNAAAENASAMSAMVRRIAMQYMQKSQPPPEPRLAPIVDEVVAATKAQTPSPSPPVPTPPITTPQPTTPQPKPTTPQPKPTTPTKPTPVTKLSRDGTPQRDSGSLTPRSLAPISERAPSPEIQKPRYRTRRVETTSEEEDPLLQSRASWSERDRERRLHGSPGGTRPVLMSGRVGQTLSTGSPIRTRPAASMGYRMTASRTPDRERLGRRRFGHDEEEV